MTEEKHSVVACIDTCLYVLTLIEGMSWTHQRRILLAGLSLHKYFELWKVNRWTHVCQLSRPVVDEANIMPTCASFCDVSGSPYILRDSCPLSSKKDDDIASKIAIVYTYPSPPVFIEFWGSINKSSCLHHPRKKSNWYGKFMPFGCKMCIFSLCQTS